MNETMAYCGLICEECPAFIATRNEDMEALAKLAVEWGDEGDAFTAEDMMCDGCTARGRIFTWCRECELRNCAPKRGVATCAHCPDYEGCDKLQRLFAMGEIGAATRARLEALR